MSCNSCEDSANEMGLAFQFSITLSVSWGLERPPPTTKGFGVLKGFGSLLPFHMVFLLRSPFWGSQKDVVLLEAAALVLQSLTTLLCLQSLTSHSQSQRGMLVPSLCPCLAKPPNGSHEIFQEILQSHSFEEKIKTHQTYPEQLIQTPPAPSLVPWPLLARHWRCVDEPPPPSHGKWCSR